jgi:hypothetical protein
MPPKDKLAPLAVDPSGKLTPAAAVAREPIEAKTEPVERPDPVSDWIKDNPEDKPYKEEAPAAAAPSSDSVVEDKTKKETPAVAPSEAKPSEPTSTTAPKPGDIAPAKTEPAPKIEPAAPVAKTYEPQERFALAEGSEWTREQIVAGLTERHKLQEDLKAFAPVKAEAEGYAQLFCMSAAQAKEAWGPILSRLAQEPHTADFIDGYMQDPALAEYLNECAAHFAQQVPAARQPQRQPPKPAVDPVMQRELRELQTWKNEQEKRSSDERVRNEWAQATARYPFLAHDNAAKQDLLATAQWMWSQDPSKGILDALALKAPVYDRLGQINAQPAEPKPQPVVPALLGSPGASPTATRSHNNRPRKFGPDDDPVKDWLENPPAQFAG